MNSNGGTRLTKIWLVTLAVMLMSASRLSAAAAAPTAVPKSSQQTVPPTEEPTAEVTPEATATVQPTVQATEQSTLQATPEKTPAPKKIPHKYPFLAGTLALVPGVAIHGAGHMYAGSWMKGLGLFAIEAASAGIAYTTVMAGADDIKKFTDNKDGGVPEDLSPVLSRTGVILVCTFAFLETWFDDIVGAPIAASEYNRRAEAAAAAEVSLRPTQDGALFVYSRRF
ncbi:MAG: hypothetical protein V4498_06005 [candidate division FCPU426 bacterium]